MARRVSLADISARAGVSRATVSLVLNGKAEGLRIAAETVERVRMAAKDLGYQPHHAARSLRTQRSGVVGLIIPDLTNHFSAALAQALDRHLRQAGFQLWIGDSEDDAQREAELLQRMQERQVEAVFLCSGRDQLQTEAQCPVIYVDRRLPGSQDWVCSDNYHAAYALTEALATRGALTSQVAWIGGFPNASSNRERRDGFFAALQDRGYDLQQIACQERDWSSAWAYAAMERLVHGGPKTLCCASFTLFQGVLDFWHERGGLPNDWQFATFDDHPLLDHLAVPVSAVRQDYIALAQAACDLLSQRLRNQTVLRNGVTIPATLHIRHWAKE